MQYTKIPCILVFSSCEEIVFSEISGYFDFLKRRYFPCFDLEKMLISLFSLHRKDTEMWYFRITEISENPPKYHLFVYFRVFSPCEKKGFCAVYFKMHPVSCTNTHHDVTDLVNHEKQNFSMIQKNF